MCFAVLDKYGIFTTDMTINRICSKKGEIVVGNNSCSWTKYMFYELCRDSYL